MIISIILVVIVIIFILYITLLYYNKGVKLEHSDIVNEIFLPKINDKHVPLIDNEIQYSINTSLTTTIKHIINTYISLITIDSLKNELLKQSIIKSDYIAYNLYNNNIEKIIIDIKSHEKSIVEAIYNSVLNNIKTDLNKAQINSNLFSYTIAKRIPDIKDSSYEISSSILNANKYDNLIKFEYLPDIASNLLDAITDAINIKNKVNELIAISRSTELLSYTIAKRIPGINRNGSYNEISNSILRDNYDKLIDGNYISYIGTTNLLDAITDAITIKNKVNELIAISRSTELLSYTIAKRIPGINSNGSYNEISNSILRDNYDKLIDGNYISYIGTTNLLDAITDAITIKNKVNELNTIINNISSSLTTGNKELLLKIIFNEYIYTDSDYSIKSKQSKSLATVLISNNINNIINISHPNNIQFINNIINAINNANINKIKNEIIAAINNIKNIESIGYNTSTLTTYYKISKYPFNINQNLITIDDKAIAIMLSFAFYIFGNITNTDKISIVIKFKFNENIIDIINTTLNDDKITFSDYYIGSNIATKITYIFDVPYIVYNKNISVEINITSKIDEYLALKVPRGSYVWYIQVGVI